MMRFLVGVDDTDNLESIGTGRLARMLAEHLEERGLLAGTSVTRHQFLVHPDIPYTSHNSSACIEGSSRAGGRALADAAEAFLRAHFQAGSNPGLCVCAADQVPGLLLDLAKRAQQEVLTLAGFDGALASFALEIRSWGQTGQGRIGASGGVALRSTGDDGRFIGLAGIRDLAGVLPAGEILARSGVAAVVSVAGEPLAAGELVDTRDWVRPALVGGRPVLRVEREAGRWVPEERPAEEY
jgi:hypothetical protein